MTRSAELSEAAWARIEPLMPQAEGGCRPWGDHRRVVEGIVFRYRTGGAWRDLPERFFLSALKALSSSIHGRVIIYWSDLQRHCNATCNG